MGSLLNSNNVWVLIPLAGILCGIIAILSGVYMQHMKLKTRQIEALANGGKGEKSAETMALEERVRVLERIATDKGLDLSTEIERLRDQTIN